MATTLCYETAFQVISLGYFLVIHQCW